MRNQRHAETAHSLAARSLVSYQRTQWDDELLFYHGQHLVEEYKPPFLAANIIKGLQDRGVKNKKQYIENTVVGPKRSERYRNRRNMKSQGRNFLKDKTLLNPIA